MKPRITSPINSSAQSELIQRLNDFYSPLPSPSISMRKEKLNQFSQQVPFKDIDFTQIIQEGVLQGRRIFECILSIGSKQDTLFKRWIKPLLLKIIRTYDLNEKITHPLLFEGQTYFHLIALQFNRSDGHTLLEMVLEKCDLTKIHFNTLIEQGHLEGVTLLGYVAMSLLANEYAMTLWERFLEKAVIAQLDFNLTGASGSYEPLLILLIKAFLTHKTLPYGRALEILLERAPSNTLNFNVESKPQAFSFLQLLGEASIIYPPLLFAIMRYHAISPPQLAKILQGALYTLPALPPSYLFAAKVLQQRGMSCLNNPFDQSQDLGEILQALAPNIKKEVLQWKIFDGKTLFEKVLAEKNANFIALLIKHEADLSYTRELQNFELTDASNPEQQKKQQQKSQLYHALARLGLVNAIHTSLVPEIFNLIKQSLQTGRGPYLTRDEEIAYYHLVQGNYCALPLAEGESDFSNIALITCISTSDRKRTLQLALRYAEKLKRPAKESTFLIAQLTKLAINSHALNNNTLKLKEEHPATASVVVPSLIKRDSPLLDKGKKETTKTNRRWRASF